MLGTKAAWLVLCHGSGTNIVTSLHTEDGAARWKLVVWVPHTEMDGCQLHWDHLENVSLYVLFSSQCH